jgi:hypothetical protein
VRGHPASSRRLAVRGLRRVTVVVPSGCAEGLLLLARRLRARQRAGQADGTLGWRRLTPRAELFVHLESGARCTIRDTGSSGVARYLWTVSVFSKHQLAAGRTGKLAPARAQAERVLAGYMAAWPELSEGCRKMTRRTPNLPIRLEQVEAPLILSAVDELAVGDGWPGGRSAERAVRSAMPRRRLKQ